MNSRNFCGDIATRILKTTSGLLYEQSYHVIGINQVIAEAQVANIIEYKQLNGMDVNEYINKLQNNWEKELREDLWN